MGRIGARIRGATPAHRLGSRNAGLPGRHASTRTTAKVVEASVEEEVVVTAPPKKKKKKAKKSSKK